MKIGDTVISVASIGYQWDKPFGLVGEVVKISPHDILVEFKDWNYGHNGYTSELETKNMWFCTEEEIVTVDEFYELVKDIQSSLLSR